MKSLVLFVALLAAISTTPASADFLTITNPGFEDIVLGNGGFIPAATGWSNSGDSGTFNPTTASYPGEAPEGQNVAYSSAGGPTIAQVLFDLLEANTTYELTMFVGNRLDQGFPGYSIQLLAGGIVIAEDNNTLAPASGEFLLSSITYFANNTDPLLGQALEIRFRSFGQQVNFDDVKLEATLIQIPEPSSALLTVIAAGMVLSRRRK